MCDQERREAERAEIERKWKEIEREYEEEMKEYEGFETWEIYGATYMVNVVLPPEASGDGRLKEVLLREVKRTLELIRTRRFAYLRITDRTRENLSKELGITIRRRRGRPIKADGMRLVRAYSRLVKTRKGKAIMYVSSTLPSNSLLLKKESEERKEEKLRKLREFLKKVEEESVIGEVAKKRTYPAEREFVRDLLLVVLDRVEKPHAFLKALERELSHLTEEENIEE